MISLTITEVKKFMSHLLVHNTFDQLYLSEAEISTANLYTISGEVNRAYYSNEEYEELTDKKYSRWASIRPFCLELIKGSKTPTAMKIVFLLPDQSVSNLIEEAGLSYTAADINGLFLNIRYIDGTLSIITGTSVRVFTMDKSLDQAFDASVRRFLDKAGIPFEE